MDFVASARHIDHADLLGKLRMSISTLVSPAESDYKCRFLQLTTTKGTVISLEARYHSMYDSKENRNFSFPGPDILRRT